MLCNVCNKGGTYSVDTGIYWTSCLNNCPTQGSCVKQLQNKTRYDTTVGPGPTVDESLKMHIL